MTDITFNTTVGSVQTTVSQGNVTLTFDTASTVGNALNGPGYILVPAGTIDITAVSPAETTEGSLVINGIKKNFAFAGTQGFDERTAGTFGASETLPLTVTAGDVVIVSTGNTSGGIVAGDAGSTRKGLCDGFATFFIVDAVPIAGSVAPASTGWIGRSGLTFRTADMTAFVAGLPSYSATNQTPPNYASIVAKLQKFAPLGVSSSNATFYQEFLPRDFGDEGANGGNYGQNVNDTINVACLALISDFYTTDQKEVIALHLTSHGSQWYDPAANDGPIDENGGHFQYFMGPVCVALQATGRSTATVVSDIGGNFNGAFQVTAAIAAKLVSHVSMNDPYPYRNRDVTAVSGLEVSVETTRSGSTGDPSQTSFVGMTITRVSDSATATVESQDKTSIASNSTDTIVCTINAQPGVAFAPSDVVYFTPGFTVLENDYDWTINGTDLINFYNPAPSAVYRNTNEWTGQMTLIKAAGWTTDLDAALGYVERANTADTPSATHDYPDHHATTWEQEFWDEHGATIFI